MLLLIWLNELGKRDTMQGFPAMALFHSQTRRHMIFFSKNYSRDTIIVSTSLDPNQGRCLVGPELGPYCFQTLSVDGTKRYTVKPV